MGELDADIYDAALRATWIVQNVGCVLRELVECEAPRDSEATLKALREIREWIEVPTAALADLTEAGRQDGEPRSYGGLKMPSAYLAAVRWGEVVALELFPTFVPEAELIEAAWPVARARVQSWREPFDSDELAARINQQAVLASRLRPSDLAGEGWLTNGEAASILSIDPGSVTNLVKSNVLRSNGKKHRACRIDQKSVAEHLRRQNRSSRWNNGR